MKAARAPSPLRGPSPPAGAWPAGRVAARSAAFANHAIWHGNLCTRERSQPQPAGDLFLAQKTQLWTTSESPCAFSGTGQNGGSARGSQGDLRDVGAPADPRSAQPTAARPEYLGTAVLQEQCPPAMRYVGAYSDRGCRRMCSQPWFRKSRPSGTSPRELLERCSGMPAGRRSVVGGRGWSVAGEVRLAPFGEAA